MPAGTYACYSYDNGLLNYTYTDVVFSGGNRYAVGKSGGRYSFGADGRLQFTGHLANAKGEYAVKNGGVPEVTLIFKEDRRASMSCARTPQGRDTRR